MAHWLLSNHKIVALVSLGLIGFAPTAKAGVVVSAAVGGAPLGATYVNFDNLALGSSGGVTEGVTVSFTGNSQAVQGSVADAYAAPYLSNGNGALFGDPNNGQDATTYLAASGGSVTLGLPGQENYIGLLWGSVDTYNSLSLYEGSTLVGTITGADVTANADGNQGVNGTFYVNITSSADFNKVVASSTEAAFEFDNVAFGSVAVPEPSSCLLALVGLVGAVCYQKVGRKRLALKAEA